MMSYHIVELWISAAKFEMETNASMDTARSLLQRGLRFNPKSKNLWLEVNVFYMDDTLHLFTVLPKRKGVYELAPSAS